MAIEGQRFAPGATEVIPLPTAQVPATVIKEGHDLLPVAGVAIAACQMNGVGVLRLLCPLLLLLRFCQRLCCMLRSLFCLRCLQVCPLRLLLSLRRVLRSPLCLLPRLGCLLGSP